MSPAVQSCRIESYLQSKRPRPAGRRRVSRIEQCATQSEQRMQTSPTGGVGHHVLVSSDEVRPHLPVAMPPESEVLVDGPQLGARFLTVKPQIPLPEALRALHGPSQQLGRKGTPGIT